MLNLDTNVLLHALGNTLTSEETVLLHSDDWSISAIVLWELALLYREGRVKDGLDSDLFKEFLRGIRVWPISPEVCIAMRSSTFRATRRMS